MWQQLINEVGLVWIILVILFSVLVLAGGVLLSLLTFNLLRNLAKRTKGLRQDVETLPQHRIENLKQTLVIVGNRGGPDMKLALEQMVDDCKDHYEGHWSPDPADRMSWVMLLNQRGALIIQPSLVTLPLLAGLLISFVFFITALSLSGTSLANEWMRFLSLLPLLIGGMAFLGLMQLRKWKTDQLEAEWRSFIIQLQRKIPVYDQAAETATLLKSYTHYDQQMTKAARQLSDRVDALASGELTEAITTAIKQVMMTTMAPPIQKSTEALSQLAQQLEKKLLAGENQLMRLYTEMTAHQDQQAEIWQKRYQEMIQTLTMQQKQSWQQLVTANQNNWQDLNTNLTSLMQSLELGQRSLQENLLSDQTHSLKAIRHESHEVISQLQIQYTSTLNEQRKHQESVLSGIEQQVQTSLSQFSETLQQLSQELQTNQQETLGRLEKSQTDLFQSLDQHQETAIRDMKEQFGTVLLDMRHTQETSLRHLQDNQASSLQQISEQQAQVLSGISEQQSQVLHGISEHQQTALSDLRSRQAEAMDGFLGHQVAALDAIRQSQQETLTAIQGHLATELEKIDTTQLTALDRFSQTHLQAIDSLARQQSEDVHKLLSQFSGQVSGILAEYLAPVTDRLSDSADALVAAQTYAQDVQKTLAMQKEQSRVLEESIRDVLGQFVETRKNMMQDLDTLAGSTKTMSESAATMSSIYAGSQTGLSDAIRQMSDEMQQLSDALTQVLSGSVEQTKLLQAQANETYEINQKQLDAVRSQIDILTNDLATRIDQLMIGFSQLTEDLINNVRSTIDEQNSQLGGGIRSLTDNMADEARSISLYAQQINMDIDELNTTLGEAVSQFSSGMQAELTGVLARFDDITADILRRLSIASSELGDAVENLPDVIRTARDDGKKG